MRVAQPSYAMELPGVWTLEELEGADRWVSGADELVVSVIRIPAATPSNRTTLLADLANAVAQSRQSARNFARAGLNLDDDAVMSTDGPIVSAQYTGTSDDGGEVFVTVMMTAHPIEGHAYIASLYVYGPRARMLGHSVAEGFQLGPGNSST